MIFMNWDNYKECAICGKYTPHFYVLHGSGICYDCCDKYKRIDPETEEEKKEVEMSGFALERLSKLFFAENRENKEKSSEYVEINTQNFKQIAEPDPTESNKTNDIIDAVSICNLKTLGAVPFYFENMVRNQNRINALIEDLPGLFNDRLVEEKAEQEKQKEQEKEQEKQKEKLEKENKEKIAEIERKLTTVGRRKIK